MKKLFTLLLALTATAALSALPGATALAVVGGPVCDVPADYLTIEAALADPNCMTINVAAGVHPEGPQVVIDHDVDIIGADRDTTIIMPTANTGNNGDARGWFLVNPGVEANIENLTFDGGTFSIYQAFRVHGTGTFDTVAFDNIRFGTAYLGWGIAALGGAGPVDVLNSTFDNIGRIGVQYFGTGTFGTFDGNTYTGKGEGDHLDYGVEVGGGAGATIRNNTFTNNLGVAASDESNSAAVLVTTFFGAGSEALIENNEISNNTIGIAVGFDASDTSTVEAHQNNIRGNENGVISTAPVVDATCNWWGDASGPSGEGPGTGDSVSEDVTFEPWLSAPAPSGCPTPATKDDCMNGGWENVFRADGTPFRNQGDCIQYVNTGE